MEIRDAQPNINPHEINNQSKTKRNFNNEERKEKDGQNSKFRASGSLIDCKGDL